MANQKTKHCCTSFRHFAETAGRIERRSAQLELELLQEQKQKEEEEVSVRI